MLLVIVLRWLALTASFAVLAWIVPSVEVSGGAGGLLWVAAVFALVDALVGPLLRLARIRHNDVLFWVSSLVVNGLLLWITAALLDVLDVGGFLATVAAAVVLSVVDWFAQALVTLAVVRRAGTG